MTIGERIKELRGDDSQDIFSAKIGVHKNTLGFYERGKNVPGADVITEICSKLDVEPRWLLMGEGPMKRGEAAGAGVAGRDQASEARLSSAPMGAPMEQALAALSLANSLQRENERVNQECRDLRQVNQRLNEKLLDATKGNADLRAQLATALARAAPAEDAPAEDARKSA